MYTIFINDAVIYLTADAAYKDEEYFVHYEDIQLSLILEKLETGVLKSIYIYHDNLTFLWDSFKSEFELIEAAGGVVFNEADKVLWIYRNNRWDLPKGKIEKNENRETAAIREVEEECGLSNIILNEFIMSTYHIYQYHETPILKVSHWYKMFAKSNQTLTPQFEEGITKVAWLDKLDMHKAISDTYDNIKLLFENIRK